MENDMYELISITDNCFYIQSPAKIGLVKTGSDEVCIIDSGNDKDAGKKVKKHIDANGWKLAAIYNTHSHADHIGGNKYLQTQTDCKIYAPGIERDFTEHTVLEPSYLYGGCPLKDLRHKFLMAQESEVHPLTDDVLPEGWEMIPLPGHSFDMVGFRTPDNVVYLADCLSSEDTLNKYQISFLVDPGAYIDTLETVRQMEARLFVPAHAAPAEDIAALAQINIDKVNEIADRIVDICSEPVNFEQILKTLFDTYKLKMTFEQYVLVGSTVRSYMTWLKENDRLQVQFEDNMLLWRRK